MKKILETEFFERPVLEVAPDLLGKFLVGKISGREFALEINEVEAYDGEKDLGCHAAKGRSKRNDVLYGDAGVFYVYLCYGMYWMLNVVTDKREYPSAVLIRGAGEYSGPGKLTRGLNIDGAFHGLQARRSSRLWIEDWGAVIAKSRIKKTPRIGVSYAGPVWSKKKYRFILTD